MNSFQERLIELLEDNNMNRLQLAKVLKIGSSTIDGYFNKNYFPNLKIAIKMCQFFNCSLDYLFGNSDIKNNNERNKNKFIDNIYSLLNTNNISIAKCMRQLNMSEHNYYRWRKGQIPNTSNLTMIAKYFDVSIDYLVGDLWK